MAFEPWNESYPAGSDAAGNIHSYIQQFKRQVRERFVALFPDWGTATDRITVQKLFVNTSHLTIRNNNDTADLAKLYNDGGLTLVKPYISVMQFGNVAGPTAGTKVTGLFTSYDPNSWIGADRITVPAGLGGTFKVTVSAMWYYNYGGGSVWEESIGFTVYKNGLSLGNLGKILSMRAGVNKYITQSYTFYINLSAADYLELYYDGSLRAEDESIHKYLIVEKII